MIMTKQKAIEWCVNSLNGWPSMEAIKYSYPSPEGWEWKKTNDLLGVKLRDINGFNCIYAVEVGYTVHEHRGLTDTQRSMIEIFEIYLEKARKSNKIVLLGVSEFSALKAPGMPLYSTSEEKPGLMSLGDVTIYCVNEKLIATISYLSSDNKIFNQYLHNLNYDFDYEDVISYLHNFAGL